jgi:glutamine synthetase
MKLSRPRCRRLPPEQFPGENQSTATNEGKDLEHEEFMRVISPWEREHLLPHV